MSTPADGTADGAAGGGVRVDHAVTSGTGPGATGRSYSDRPTLEASIRASLFGLPDDTIVHTGHGEDTTIGAEAAVLGR